MTTSMRIASSLPEFNRKGLAILNYGLGPYPHIHYLTPIILTGLICCSGKIFWKQFALVSSMRV